MSTMEVLCLVFTSAFTLDCMSSVAERVMHARNQRDNRYTEAELDEAFDDGFREGKEEDSQDSFEDGYAEGLTQGREDAAIDRYLVGYDRGFEEGTNQVPVEMSVGEDLTQEAA